MNPLSAAHLQLTRRQFFGRTATGLGAAALGSLLNSDALGALAASGHGLPHFPPKAKRVILLWQGGGPSQVDLFDYKPGLEALRMQELPDSVRSSARLSTMTSTQKKFPILPALKPFKQYGRSGRWLSELIPHIGGIADEMCLINSMHTEAVNHAPGVTFCLTGSQIPGRPSMGSWLTYGLGSLAEDLPAFVVMTSSDQQKTCGQLFYEHYWGSGFIPSKFQGVRLRSEGEPVLYLNDAPGLDRTQKRALLDDIAALNHHQLELHGDPETDTRIAQYEMGFKMQASVPGLLDLGQESPATLASYGPDVHRLGSYARNCLLARRLAERGVRFIQLMHGGWDQHRNLATQLEVQCRDTDQPTAALVHDLRQRGLLEDTLVIYAGEFGRTVFVQGDITKIDGYGRDHLGSAYSTWMAGGGVKAGTAYGETDEFSYGIARDGVHVHDWQATILHLLGIDHERLTYRYQGRQFRLSDVHGQVVKGLLA
ncbi:MAG: DUF1501 domain-containing protein [Opitutus sp.]|nr:DUF1501 domain-containing protein [Opitutus sp.]